MQQKVAAPLSQVEIDRIFSGYEARLAALIPPPPAMMTPEEERARVPTKAEIALKRLQLWGRQAIMAQWSEIELLGDRGLLTRNDILTVGDLAIDEIKLITERDGPYPRHARAEFGGSLGWMTPPAPVKPPPRMGPYLLEKLGSRLHKPAIPPTQFSAGVPGETIDLEPDQASKLFQIITGVRSHAKATALVDEWREKLKDSDDRNSWRARENLEKHGMSFAIAGWEASELFNVSWGQRWTHPVGALVNPSNTGIMQTSLLNYYSPAAVAEMVKAEPPVLIWESKVPRYISLPIAHAGPWRIALRPASGELIMERPSREGLDDDKRAVMLPAEQIIVPAETVELLAAMLMPKDVAPAPVPAPAPIAEKQPVPVRMAQEEPAPPKKSPWSRGKQ